VGLGITGAGVAMVGASALLPDLQRGARIGGGSVGGVTCAVGLTWIWGASLKRSFTVAGLMSPGRWWTPEAADALITAYNAELE
jgi:hypothetical protein